jgi:GNAT superfamily N-acetyltransferase
VETREIVEHDFTVCVDIFTDAWNDLHRRYGFEQEVSEDDSWLLKVLAHFGQTDPHGGRIALVDGVPIAFGQSVRRRTFWCLSFLFVRPDAQGRGVGRRLLRELLPGDRNVVRVCEVESFQTVATALYLSAGMAPCSVRYFLAGPARPGSEPGPRCEGERSPDVCEGREVPLVPAAASDAGKTGDKDRELRVARPKRRVGSGHPCRPGTPR